jgi:hypothetical protein
MFSTRWTIFNNPKRYEKAFTNYLLEFGKVITKEKTIGNIVAMHRQSVVGLLSANFFNGVVVAGATNLNSFVRPEGEHFLVERIRLYQGAGATLNAIDWVPGITLAELLNGFISVIENGVTVLNQIPITQFNQTTTNELYAGYLILEEPIIWGGQETMVVNANWPIVLATANQAMQVEACGMGLLS